MRRGGCCVPKLYSFCNVIGGAVDAEDYECSKAEKFLVLVLTLELEKCTYGQRPST